MILSRDVRVISANAGADSRATTSTTVWCMVCVRVSVCVAKKSTAQARCDVRADGETARPIWPFSVPFSPLRHPACPIVSLFLALAFSPVRLL